MVGTAALSLPSLSPVCVTVTAPVTDPFTQAGICPPPGGMPGRLLGGGNCGAGS